VRVSEQFSIDGLRAALRQKPIDDQTMDDARFEALGRRFERAVAQLIKDVHEVVNQIPELTVTLEDEVEEFTSPAFPGKTMNIRDQRLRITRDEDMLLFDPTGKALLSALGQIEIEATRPLPFMIERILFLIPDHGGGAARWGYRSVDNLGGPLAPFTPQVLLRMLHTVFANG
jgi:hypothetical protein